VRPADAVDVVLRVERQVVVDDVRDAVDVEAARRDVGRDEDGQRAVLEALQDAKPAALVDVAGDGGGGEAVRRERPLDALGGAPHVREHEHARLGSRRSMLTSTASSR
jgi:hypothetical protein